MKEEKQDTVSIDKAKLINVAVVEEEKKNE